MNEQPMAQMIVLGPENTCNNEEQTIYNGPSCLETHYDANVTAPSTVDSKTNEDLSNPLCTMILAENIVEPFKKLTTPFPGSPEISCAPSAIDDPALSGKELKVSETAVEGTIPISCIQPSESSPMETTTVGTLNNVYNDATDASCSDFESSDSDFEDEDRVVVRKWEDDRARVAWRWSWLRLQMEELQQQLEECDKISEEIRKKKPTIISNRKKEEEESASRACPIQLSKRFRTKLIFQEPPKEATLVDQSSHPALRLKEKRRTQDDDKFSSPKPEKRKNPPLRLHTPLTPRMSTRSTAASPRISSPLTSSAENCLSSPRTRRQRKKESENSDNFFFPSLGMFSPRQHKDIVTPTWQAIDRSTNRPIDGPTDGPIDINAAFEDAIEQESKRRKQDGGSPKEDDGKSDEQPREGSVPIKLDNTQECSPPLAEGSTHFVPPIDAKEDVVTEMSTSLCFDSNELGLKSSMNEPSDDTKDGSPINNVKFLPEQLESQDADRNSTEEDTGDEAFCYRHFCRELLERKRYLFPDKNKQLPASPNQLPVEFFVSVLAESPGKRRRKTSAADLEKVRQKYEKIKWRYLNIQQEQKTWEELSYLANHKEIRPPRDFVEIDTDHEFFNGWSSSSEEEEEVAPSTPPVETPSPDIWNIIDKPPLLDEQGRRRNIICLKRVVTAESNTAPLVE
jgi:hypothetical protein